MKTGLQATKSRRRIFYVTYPNDKRRQRILDAIRFLADPSEKSCAHVTVRGPYQRRQEVTALSKSIAGSELKITGVDAFLRPGQSTVFFAIAAPGLKAAWRKPDYPGYKPHLTIYDGKSRDFAHHLWVRLQEINPTFTLNAGPLAPLTTIKGQHSLELRAAYNEQVVKDLTGRRISPDAVANLPAEERINLIAALCSELSEHKSDSGKQPSTSK